MGKLRKVLIMAGGTGGHVFPGLSVADELKRAGVTVHWLGTRKGLEARLVPHAGIPIDYISISGLRGKGWKDVLLAPWRITVALLQALKIIRRLKPDVVLGMGGFVSGPGGIASVLLRCPLVIHEQNSIPGTTNKYLAYVAKKVLEGFPNTFLNRKNVVTVGNPVRADIIGLPRSVTPQQVRGVELAMTGKSEEPLHLLVLGGSLGSQAINQLLPKALAKIPKLLRPVVYHQTGEKHQGATIKAYSEAGVTAKIDPFISEMDQAYAWADIVLCRAGALTVAELCAAGVGAILIPFPYAVDDHQTSNANFMGKQGAALVIQQRELTTDGLAELIRKFQKTPEKVIEMGRAAYQLRKQDAAEQIYQICEEICH